MTVCLPNAINLSVMIMNVVAPELLLWSPSYRHDVDLAPLAVDGGSLSVADCRNGRFWNIIDRYSYISVFSHLATLLYFTICDILSLLIQLPTQPVLNMVSRIKHLYLLKSQVLSLVSSSYNMKKKK